MMRLVNMLAPQVGRPIIDRTNLTGLFDFGLKWSPSFVPDAALPNAGVAPANEASGPSIFTAIQEQLGLKLESGKAAAEVLVIDHVERPSEN